MSRNIEVFDQQKDLNLSPLKTQAVVETVLQAYDHRCLGLSVYFVSKQKICQLHKEFFNDPSLTDCITFPIDDEYLGDVFVCPYTALITATDLNLEVYDEVKLYLVHTLLHLLGYRDSTETEQQIMREMEKKTLTHVAHLSLNPNIV